MIENRNLILAIVLSVVILFGFEYLYGMLYPQPETAPGGGSTVSESGPSPTATPGTGPTAPAPPSVAAPDQDLVPPPPGGQTPAVAAPPMPSAREARNTLLAGDERVRINTPRLHGSIALRGGRLDDVTLIDYREALDRTSPEIVLLTPAGLPDAYFAQVGWVMVSGQTTLPDAETVWTADGDELSPATPVTLRWTNPEGVSFYRTFAIDDNFMLTLTQRVVNDTDAALSVMPYGLVVRYGLPDVGKFFILHEGPLGVFDGTLKEVDYDDVQSAGTIQMRSEGGWIGITDKYWLTALVPASDESNNFRFFHERVDNRDRFQVDFVGPALSVAAGDSAEAVSRLFVGAKEVRLLDHYAERYGVTGFDRAIDFGWFYFLTKPIFYFLLYLKDWTGNLGVAILLLTVVIKLLFFPLANKSYRAMSQMRKLQPEIMKMKERFGDDKVRFNQEMMALYKREKVNPASGCLPMVVQIPVFFALYKVLFVTIEMRHAPFFGWVQDLSAPDPTSVWNLFGLIPWEPSTIIPAMINIGAWPLIMGATMWFQQKINPQPTDPMQARIMMLLPVIFTFLLAQFPAGLVIYWAWNNVLSIAQQWVIMRRMGVKI